MQEVIFDIETKKFFQDIETKDPKDLGVSIVSLYARELDETLKEVSGKMMSFWEEEFEIMWPYFRDADRIIGFNSIKFDVPALQPYTHISLSKLPHFDILEQFKTVAGHRISLSVLARDTLGHTKTDSGENAILYWNKRDVQSLAKLKSYCESDVAVTKELYDYGLQHGHLKFRDKWNDLKTVPVDFSYPKTLNQQASLF